MPCFVSRLRELSSRFCSKFRFRSGSRSRISVKLDSSLMHVPDRRYGCKILYESGNAAAVDILFVHGLTGDRITTWTAKNGICWPRDLLHTVIPDARIIVFGYDADVAHFWSPASQNSIDDHTQTLVNSIGILRERDNTVRKSFYLIDIFRSPDSDRPLILVGHSLGGLIIQNALLVSWSSVEGYRQKLIESTRAIIFLGTPHCGSAMGSWIEYWRNILAIVRKPGGKILSSLNAGSEVLSGIQDRFHTLLRRLKEEKATNITLICFYEELYVSWMGKKVVPDTSAKLNGYVNEGIRANHMDMTKFNDVEDPGFEKVSNQIWLCLRDSLKVPVAVVGTPPPLHVSHTF